MLTIASITMGIIAIGIARISQALGARHDSCHAMAMPMVMDVGRLPFGPPLGRSYHVTRHVTRCGQKVTWTNDRALLNDKNNWYKIDT